MLEPRRSYADGREGLLHCHGLLGAPCRALVERAQRARDDARERIELLDGRVGAVREPGARVEQRAICVGAVATLPEAVGEVAVGRRVAELHRGGNADAAEAGDVARIQQLRVLDPLAQAARLPLAATRLERVERGTVRGIA